MYTNTTAATAPVQSPEVVLSQMAFGALMTQALSVVAKLGIADMLAEKPQSTSHLAAATKTDEQGLYRVLRSVASVGVFREIEPTVFASTALSELLRSDVPNSMRNGMIFMGEEWHWKVWGEMMHSVRTGKPAWGHVHGAEVFDYFPKNPEHAEIFNGAMTDMSVGTAWAVVEA